MRENVTRKPGHEQVCVWRNATIGDDSIEKFETFMLEKFGIRVQYLEEIEVELETGSLAIPRTEKRSDLFFGIHSDDVDSFAHRLELGIVWVEDALSTVNYRRPIYPARVLDYRTWNADATPLAKLFDGTLFLRDSTLSHVCVPR